MRDNEKGRPGVTAPKDGPKSNHARNNVTPEDVSHNLRGQVIGSFTGKVLRKKVRASKHFLRKPPAIAWDVEAIKKADGQGTERLEVEDTDTGQVYYCQLQTLFKHGFKFDRGHGRQIGLTLNYWQRKDAKQPTLFEV